MEKKNTLEKKDKRHLVGYTIATKKFYINERSFIIVVLFFKYVKKYKLVPLTCILNGFNLWFLSSLNNILMI